MAHAASSTACSPTAETVPVSVPAGTSPDLRGGLSRRESELDQDSEWDQDWPSDDDGDWSGCDGDGDGE